MQIFDIKQSFYQIFNHILPKTWFIFGEKISRIGHQTETSGENKCGSYLLKTL
jgi:hypothetical protein